MAAPQPLGDGRGAVAADPVIEVAETQASVAAWRARQRVVGIEESREDGKVAVKGVRAAARRRRAGRADRRLGPRRRAGRVPPGRPGRRADRGRRGGRSPQAFAVEVPLKFVRSQKVRLDWDTPRNALSQLRYTVRIGKRTVARNLERSFYRVPTRKLKDGRLPIVVTATDGNGQRSRSTAGACCGSIAGRRA